MEMSWNLEIRAESRGKDMEFDQQILFFYKPSPLQTTFHNPSHMNIDKKVTDSFDIIIWSLKRDFHANPDYV